MHRPDLVYWALVFTIPDALKLALQAPSSNNRNPRGTALEYLDNVLPEDLRRRLWQHLDLNAADKPRRPRRATDGGKT